MKNQIPSVLNNLSCYRNGSEYLGVADVDLPDFELATETISGAGVGGEINMPIFGQYGSMSITINWKVLEKALFKLSRMESHHLDFRGSFQAFDVGTGAIKHVPIKLSVRTFPKTTSLGSMAPQSTMDSSNEMEIHYIKVLIDNEVMAEIDKFGYICVIDGTDFAAQIRANLGL